MQISKILFAIFWLAAATNLLAENFWAGENHVLTVGDFNGDGYDDLFVQDLDAEGVSGIVLTDPATGEPSILHQTWTGNYLNTFWYGNTFRAVAGDFNGDGRDDLLLQRQLSGNHKILLAQADGSFTAVNYTIAANAFGFDFSRAAHRLIVGDFNGDGRDDLFAQGLEADDLHAVLLANASGAPFTGVFSSWVDASNHLGYAWSAGRADVHAGYFDADSISDLLVLPRPDIVMIASDIVLPVTGVSNAAIQRGLGDGNFETYFSWHPSDWAFTWSPTDYNVVVADFDGDGNADILLQSRTAGRDSYLVRSDSTGQFTSTSDYQALNDGSLGTNWNGEHYRALAGNFDGTVGAEIYLHANEQGRDDALAELSVSGDVVGTSVVYLGDASAAGLATAVGHTAGQFSVDPSGGATYRIPLALPPGAAGVAPELALIYNSRAGNGLLGVGWSLSGTSAITRCPQTVAQDGVSRGVDLSATDRFCLDGQRLIVINGTYGADGAEYRTEVESFQKVVSHGQVQSGVPAYFEVKDKSGMTRFYGKDGIGRIEAEGSANVLTWAVGRMEDRYGNFIAYEYAEDSVVGEFRPTAIRYGNVNDKVLAFVELDYVGRADDASGYISGSRVGTTRRLTSIKTYTVDGSINVPVREYKLGYMYNSVSNLSQLDTLQECELTTDTCLAPTEFTWQTGSRGFTGEQTTGVGENAMAHRKIGDFDGNGRPDFLYEESGKWRVRWDSIAGQVTNTGKNALRPEYAIVMDYNGDGYSDIVQSSTATANFQVLLGSKNRSFSYAYPGVTSTGLSENSKDTTTLDIDGNGLTDFAYIESVGNQLWLRVRKNTPSGFESTTIGKRLHAAEGITGGQAGPDAVYEHDNLRLHAINFDSDGRGDLMVVMNHCYWTGEWTVSKEPIEINECVRQLRVYSDRGNGLAVSYASSESIDFVIEHPKPIDINGDGLTDLLFYKSSRWQLWTSTGSDFDKLILPQSVTLDVNPDNNWNNFPVGGYGEPPDPFDTITIPLNQGRLDKAKPLDYNKDGRGDLMISHLGAWYVLLSSGTGYDSDVIETTYTATAPDKAFLIDITGDGLSDLLYPSGGTWKYRVQRGPRPGLLARIVDGLGSDIQIEYSLLTDTAVYKGDTPMPMSGAQPTFPVRHFLAPMPVVSRYAADNGRDDSTVYTIYEYKGAKAHVQGRGLLGFSEIKSWNDNTGIETINTQAQAYPYTGMLLSAQQKMPDYAEYDSQTQNPTPSELWMAWADECEINPNDCHAANPSMPSPSPAPNIITGSTISQTDNVLENNLITHTGSSVTTDFPHVQKSTELVHPLNSGEVGTIPHKRTILEYVDHLGAPFGYDRFGNAKRVRTSIDDPTNGSDEPFIIDTKNFYTDNESTWCLGRLTRSEVTHTRPDDNPDNTGVVSGTRVATFQYNGSCALTHEWTEPDEPDKWLHKSYTHDAFGNRRFESIEGHDISLRVTEFGYDDDGRFLTSATNPLDHESSATWDPRFGIKLQTTDVNGLTKTRHYDGFGRTVREASPLPGVWVEYDYEWCDNWPDCAAGAVYALTEYRSDGQQAMQEFDRLGRAVRTRQRAFDGRFVNSRKLYDPLAREFASSAPYFDGETVCWKYRVFDQFDRVLQEWAPASNSDCVSESTVVDYNTGFPTAGGKVTNSSYAGITATTIQDPTGRTVVRVQDLMDRLIEVYEWWDHDDNPATSLQEVKTRYGFDAFGNSTWVEDAAGNQTHLSYDIRGHKTGMTDPDMGTWQYVYDALGRLKEQTDAKGQITTMEYDVIGRLKSRIESGAGTEKTDWFYDTAAGAGVGKLARVEGPYTGSSHGPYDYQETYAYDSYGRVSTLSRRISGTTYDIDQTYDDQGRVDVLTYPELEDGYRHAVRQDFNDYGFAKSVRNAQGPEVYWTADTMDSLGNVTQETLGNGLRTTRTIIRATGFLENIVTGVTGSVQNLSFQWDDVGNLTRREDITLGIDEDFEYDSMHRLRRMLFTNPAVGANNLPTEYAYDSIGNILSKDAFSGYLYAGSGHAHSQPHAVTEVNAGGTIRNYTYDANGNMTSGGGRSISWTMYNKPRFIYQSGSYSFFNYGPDRSRVRQVKNKNPGMSWTYYVGGLYERNVLNSSNNEHRHYIRVGNRVVATFSRWTNGNEQTRYLHRDHQSSVTAITDESGEIVDQFSYDPWGKRRDATTWEAGTPGTFLSPAFVRGYTGHEHLDHVGLIHMNGRVYDPELGRFLSADPHVQFAASTQGFNRYSYGGNNPLSYSDPSGFFLKKLMKIASILINFIPGFQGWSTAFFRGFLTGFLGSGGNFKMALLGGIGGVVFGKLHDMDWGFQKIIAHGLAGGALSKAGGGRFKDGFLGAAAAQTGARVVDKLDKNISTAAARAKRVAVAAVVGGTSSALGGGKFGNGAITAAFARLYNDESRLTLLGEELHPAVEDILNMDISDNEKLNRLAQLGKDAEVAETAVNKMSDEHFRDVFGEANPADVTFTMDLIERQANYLHLRMIGGSNGVDVIRGMTTTTADGIFERIGKAFRGLGKVVNGIGDFLSMRRIRLAPVHSQTFECSSAFYGEDFCGVGSR